MKFIKIIAQDVTDVPKSIPGVCPSVRPSVF